MFLQRQVPLAICFVVGVVFVFQDFVPHHDSEQLLTVFTDWGIIITGFASLLGVGSLIQVHWLHIKRQNAGWGYSVVTYVAMVGTLAAGIASGGKAAPDAQTGVMPAFGWVYNYTMVPLQGTMFAILAFFVASVAFRSFRARSVDSVLLLVAAVILLVGNVPLGEAAWRWVMPEGVPGIADVGDWVMNTLNLAVRRAILIGVALGIVATSLKFILGIERGYLGGGD
ncbi:MAG: hypothetical protein HY722_10315 [Planctomycetes bacterium]|nr:hypothetical protein [Planctomycetota bacterium]